MRVLLDIPLTVGEICRASLGTAPAYVCPDSPVKAICTDTRECRKDDLFVAVSGVYESGEKYISEALSKGAFVISSGNEPKSIRVESGEEALLKISAYYKKKISPKHTVAVTGSVGKSTTVSFLSTILQERFKTHRPKKNYNNHIGVPLTLFDMPRTTEVLIVELGMNHKNEISRLSRCVSPDLGIITRIGTAHIGNLGSRNEIATAKLEILDGMDIKNLLLPYGEPLLRAVTGGLYVGRNTLLSDFSLNDSDNYKYLFRSRKNTVKDISFFDRREHLLTDLAFAISAATVLGLSDHEIINGVLAIRQSNLRQKFIELHDLTIFDDSYNASLESITEDLLFISSLNRPTGVLIGDVLELGAEAARIHEEIGRAAGRLKIGHLYIYGQYADYIARGAIKEGIPMANVFVNKDISSPQITVDQINENHYKGEIVLFKASHLMRLDKIADMMIEEERKNNE